ncbi:hypothetical protein Acr_00g0044140 [Actinidia rufa]|uniref:Reverse transcriptase/retrotransposon-derived protein RNase H-like domain-containing protein n=1 Tax=Actinidia rufa TaxID=165716 RepID=A0A7J0DIS3_9ERIC|nr:hypothetical protein Acr_00g0044140 [Actinidia rufa]
MPTLYKTPPQTIHILPPHLFRKILINLAIPSDQVIRIRRIAIVLVRDIQLGAVSSDQQVHTPGEEGVLVCWNLDHLAELKIRWVRKLRDGEDHLAGMTKLIGIAISQQQVISKLSMEDLDREDIQPHLGKGMLERKMAEQKKRFTTSPRLSYDKMRIGRDRLYLFHTPLVGFGGGSIPPWIDQGAPNFGGRTSPDYSVPLKQILQQPDTSGKLLKWSIKLSEFHISYRPRMAIKAQTLADFIVEFTHDVAPNPEMEALKEQNQDDAFSNWKLFVDGSSNQYGCGVGLIL